MRPAHELSKKRHTWTLKDGYKDLPEDQQAEAEAKREEAKARESADAASNG